MSETNAKGPMSQRIEWLDVAKGLGIIFVIYGHTIFKDELWRIWIYSFHMPLFFFLSGITYNEEKYSDGRKFLVSKIKGILIPYFIFCVIALLRNIVEQLYMLLTMGKAFDGAVLVKKVIGIVVALRGSAWACAAWFLPCIFVVFILMYGTFKAAQLWKAEKKVCMTVAATVFLVAGLLYAKSGFPYVPWSIDAAFVAFFFTALGWLCKHTVTRSVKTTSCIAAIAIGGGQHSLITA